MNTSRLLAAVYLGSAVFLAPGIAGAAGGGGGISVGGETSQETPSANPKKAHTKRKTTNKKTSAVEEFRAGYKAAYALIYDNGDYEDGIAALRALGHDDDPHVANLIGYASRKVGRYDEAKLWYDRALAADPNFVLTRSYLGMWHAEQGNVLKAKEELEKVGAICGNTDCPEYKMLKDVIDGTVTY